MAEDENQEKAEKDLERMTVKELRAIAAEETELVGIHAMKKAELLEAIKEAKGIEEEKAPAEEAPEEEVPEEEVPEEEVPEEEAQKEKAPKKKAPEEKAKKEELTSKELKAKIAELKVKKEEFRKARDRRMVEVLRRRINRAKKRTRKLAQP
jgi:hypothetical protein